MKHPQHYTDIYGNRKEPSPIKYINKMCKCLFKVTKIVILTDMGTLSFSLISK